MKIKRVVVITTVKI